MVASDRDELVLGEGQARSRTAVGLSLGDTERVVEKILALENASGTLLNFWVLSEVGRESSSKADNSSEESEGLHFGEVGICSSERLDERDTELDWRAAWTTLYESLHCERPVYLRLSLCITSGFLSTSRPTMETPSESRISVLKRSP